MVEKIPVRPESVRGLGNIISPAKKLEDFSVFNSSLSYVDGFYTMEYSTTSVRVELTASASSITVGESLVLTATVTDGGTAVEGASVSFTSGNLAIGTAVTGSDGVATLTVSTLEAGSYSITATYDEVVSSAVTVTVSYGFTSVTVTSDKSILSYTDSESATLTAQLMNGDASASISGVTVQFYKYVDGTNDVLLGSGVTDSNGEATYSYSSQGVGDVGLYAKVRSLVSKIYELQDCLRYDLATSDKTSSYGACITYRGSGTTTWSYSANDGYRISIANSTEGMTVLSELTGKNDFTVEFDVKMNNVQSVTSNAIGLCAYEDNNNYSRINLTNVKIAQRVCVNGTATESESNLTNSINSSQLVLFKYTITDNQIVEEVTQGTTIIGTRTISYNVTANTKFGICGIWQKLWAENNYFKNIKVKPL